MRGDLEDQRLERLAKMHDMIRALKGLSDEGKKRVTRKLKSLMEQSPAKAIESAEPQIEVEVQADPADIIGLLLSSEERGPGDRPSEQVVQPIEQPAEQRSQPEGTEKASVSVTLLHTGPLLDGAETNAHIAISQLQTQTPTPTLIPPLALGDSNRLFISPFTHLI